MSEWKEVKLGNVWSNDARAIKALLKGDNYDKMCHTSVA